MRRDALSVMTGPTLGSQPASWALPPPAAVPGAAVSGHGEHVAVAGEAPPELFAQPGQGGAAAQEQTRRSQAPGRQHHDLPPDRPVQLTRGVEQMLGVAIPGADVLEVANGVPARAVGRDADRLAARADLRALAHGRAEVVEVERVLGPLVAPHVALTAQAAGATLSPVEVVVGRKRHVRNGRPVAGGESDRQRRALDLQPRRGGGPSELHRLGRGGVGLDVREGLRAQYLLRVVVMGGERGVVERPAVERVGRLAQEHVGVDERAAAQAAGHDRGDVGEGPHLEQPEQP